jgi:hypothetical protein
MAVERARAALERLRELAAGGAAVDGGFTDAEMDGWAAEVPEAVRIVLREIGGIEVAGLPLAFGPRGREKFAAGYWTLGELAYEEGALIVGVDGEGREDWGPVLVVREWDDGEVTVEAASFTAWLGRLCEDAVDDRPEPEVAVAAVPSVEAAEGPDAELAALVGRGHSLTDVVDLRALPGLPCRVEWEPYYSTAYNTIDTSGSGVRFSVVGGGRALLIESEVCGDFLGRPVRRHRPPEDAPRRAVAELRALAAELGSDAVTVHPGCSDAEMDTWPVPVPEDIRTVLREIGGLAMPGLPPLRLLPGAPEHAVDPETHRMMGGDGSYWPIARVQYARQTALAQVRIDGETGEWGYVVSMPAGEEYLRRHPEVTLLARSLPELLLTVARLARVAASRADGGGDFAKYLADSTAWFFPNTGEPWARPVPLTEWAEPPHRLAGLPSGTYAADLSDVPIPCDLCFYRGDGWPYTAELDHLRFPSGGRLAAAIPVGGKAG